MKTDLGKVDWCSDVCVWESDKKTEAAGSRAKESQIALAAALRKRS